MCASPAQDQVIISSAEGNRVAVSQPGGSGTPAVLGILDSYDIFWPELELSFARDGFVEWLEIDGKPEDWSYVAAETPEKEAAARSRLLAERQNGKVPS